MKDIKKFKPLIRLLGKDKIKLIIAGFLILTEGIFEISTGYLNGRAVEEISQLHIKEALMYLGIYFLIGAFVYVFILDIARAMIRKIETKLMSNLGFNIFRKVLDLPAYAYEKLSTGEISNRIITDSETVSFTFERLIDLFASMLSSIIVLVYIYFNSWIIGVFIIINVIILLLLFKKYDPELTKIHKKRKKMQDKFTSLSNESIRGIREIKTLGIKKNVLYNMNEIKESILKKNKDEINLQIKFDIMTRIIKTIMEVGTFILCAILMYYGKTNLTFFVAMTYYVYRFNWLIQEFDDFNFTYKKVVVSLKRINEIIENRIFKDQEFGDNSVQNIKGVIEFKNVTFNYPKEDIVLRDFSVKLEPNKKIAIVGRSGGGKSTLFNLLTRVFDVEKGKILLDGIDIKSINENDLRKSISIIRQEPFIFNRTIKENFKLVDPNIKLNDIRKYCKAAYIDDYIMSLPKKYNTILGEGGVNLSGGQKQRLAIARTLSKNTKVILFDEATSALDNESQEYIKKSIDNLVKDHTIIIVAHRLSTIMDADIIYLVDKGKLVASGTHEYLLKNSKDYKTLYTKESLNS